MIISLGHQLTIETQTMKTLRKWLPLFGTQFLGVLNDNFFKSLVCFVSVLWLADGESESLVVTLATGLLVAPYILFSPLASRFARIRSKRNIVVWAKFFEIPIMLVAGAGFFFESIPVVLTALFLMGLQSALYSPSKYGLIRDIGGLKGLSFGTGTMELLSFVAVLLGTVLAGIIADLPQALLFMIATMLGLAVIGWITSLKIEAEEEEVETEKTESIRPLRFLRASFRWSKGISGLNMTIVGLAAFWLIGSMLQMNLIIHLPHTMGLSKTSTSIVIALVAVGIGAGCWLAGVLAKGRVEVGMVPFGGLGMAVCLGLLGFADLSDTAFIVTLVIGAMFSGFFKVPLSAWIQERVKGRKLGQILAYNNMVTFISILISAGLFGLLETYFDTFAIFKVMSIVALTAAIVTIIRIPALVLRFVIYVLARTIYRVRVSGFENMPKDAGALVIANHVSYLDAFLLVAAAPRTFRFVMHQSVYDHKLLHWMMRKLHMIPVNPRGGKNDLEIFNQRCQEQINEGHVVCIFAEGTISRTGHLLGFKKGMEFIAAGIDAPIIPVHLDGVHGTPFSYEVDRHKMIGLAPWRWRRRVRVCIGEALQQQSNSFQTRQVHQALQAEAFAQRVHAHDHLAVQFVQTARKLDLKPMIKDEQGREVSYRNALLESIELALKWKEQLTGVDRVAVVLPQTVNSVLTNIALSMLGKTVVNIDLQLPNGQIKALVHRSRATALIGSYNFKTIADGVDTACKLFIEDTLNDRSVSKKLQARFLAAAYGAYYLVEYLAGTPIQSKDIATVVYERDEQSGSYLGIPLSHHNILTNQLALRQVYAASKEDTMLGIMPFSRSFGYCHHLWMPVLQGMRTVYPLQRNSIFNWEQFILDEGVNIIAGKNDLIESMVKAYSDQIWMQMKHVLTGNRIQADVKHNLKETFNLEVKESFGFAETTSVIAINTPDYKGMDIAGKNLLQLGTHRDRVGRPVPGVEIKVVDPENFDRELSAEEVGLLLVRGPHVIDGYEEGSGLEQRFHEGWFVTGEQGFIDEKGFLGLAC